MNEHKEERLEIPREVDPSLRDFQEVFQDSQNGLRSFLVGRLSQLADAEDCLQRVCIKMMQHGQSVSPSARRAWLFRVAANEAALFWRMKAANQKVTEQVAMRGSAESSSLEDDPAGIAIDRETIQQIEHLIRTFPAQWQQIIHLRIHENYTFAQIADRLSIPLGTTLTTMRRAMQKLRNELEQTK